MVSNSEYAPAQLDDMRSRLSGVRLIENDSNRGYAGGVNRGLPECNAPFVYILNPDCRLADHKTSELVAFMKHNPTIAAVGPRVKDERGALQPSCRRFPRPWTFLLVRSFLRKIPGAGQERRRYLMEDFDHNSWQDVDWVSGGAMLVRKSAIDAAGPMDERFFLYMEDVDWCRRFWQAGFRVTYFPHGSVVHAGVHGSIQSGFFSPHTRMHLTSMGKYIFKYLFAPTANRATGMHRG